MVALIGFAMIVAIVFLLLKGKMSPIVVLTLIPAIAALLLGFGPIEIADFIKDGIKTTTSNGILFIFSVIYFGVMSDTGMFDVIVQKLVKLAGNNVIAVTVATALIATIAHLDGTTATTVLITIPALYPVYKKMNIDTRILLCLTGACMGVMNLLPIPALDGGRIVGLLLTTLIERITRKKLNPKYEAWINGVGMVLLLLLIAVITFKDIFHLFT